MAIRGKFQELDGVREVGHDGNLDGSVAIIVIIALVGTPYGVPMLIGFVVLQRGVSRLIKSTKTFL